MLVTVETEEGPLSFMATTLEVARIVSSAFGFECDLEPGAPGHCKLTATRGDITIVTNGTTTYDAAEKLIRKLAHD